MISGKNLTKKFDDRTLFSNVDFKLSGKKKIGLVGRNGCGKSTLFKMINGNITELRNLQNSSNLPILIHIKN